MFRWTLQSIKSEVVPPGQRERTGHSLQTFRPVLCRARQGMRRCTELAQGILGRTIVENGTKRCSKMQQVRRRRGSQVAVVCNWASLRLSAKVQGQHSAKIAREPPDGKEKRGLGPPGSVQDLPASPPEASASKVTPLSGTPSPPKAKTSAQHCGTLPNISTHSIRIHRARVPGSLFLWAFEPSSAGLVLRWAPSGHRLDRLVVPSRYLERLQVLDIGAPCPPLTRASEYPPTAPVDVQMRPALSAVSQAQARAS
ncbi:hypothetical protein BDP81DRAFT_41801 [Colletotrichum phormii]|uniref:Uncharacterized protein n=1 Tax=Colletotrichum phormii TaxID=359342 RepID=A0AAJ0EDE1_9PEZI|nr:uncharacterized protein BDP81DRAFT_41801 [Colletotrichum phormii]KAK1635797.1 hypothetical protein BDP81DRAFT_41801 [Colletotrichum phormii]